LREKVNKFLADINPRSLNQSDHGGIKPISLFLGKGANALEVVFYQSPAKPNTLSISKIWADRKAGRSSPILAVIEYPNGVALCGPSGDQPPIFYIQDFAQAERISRVALLESDRHAAIRFLTQALPSLESELPGIVNEGLFAQHTLVEEMAKRSDWISAQINARKAVNCSGDDLVKSLGFSVKRIDNLTHLLKSKDERTALAVMLQEGEIEEAGSERFNNLSPISYALTKADKERLPWVIFIQGNRIRLYSVNNQGVGRRGRTETYLECQSSLLADKNLSYLWLIFSADALLENGSINELLESSKRFSGDLASKLRERIYNIVMPELASGIVASRKLKNPTSEEIYLTYEMALVILFRLLFLAYAEDRDLLPYKSNELYRRRSLKLKAQELACVNSEVDDDDLGHSHWVEAVMLFDAIYSGNREWGVPAYGGTIFESNPEISKAGFELKKIAIENRYFEKALRALITTHTAEGINAPVDFRSLSVREFGTIYEGLLESELSLADQDLTLDGNGNYLPAKDHQPILVRSGEIFLHDKSGARKSSGSFYTPDFAVEYLLDISLEKSLNNHLQHLDNLDDLEAGECFFDFRVADISMGSGHFLVAAIDRIEKKLSEYLESRGLIGVKKELNDLRIVAIKQLKEYQDNYQIEDGQLLRRLIARRCIYGVDLNPLAVQLAKLSIWIHSFVPGLPLSLLDHNLVVGNALVGVGSISEIREKLDQAGGTLFEIDADYLLGMASQPLKKLAKLSDSTIQDINLGRELIKDAIESIEETRALCDLITAQPISSKNSIKFFRFEDWEELRKNYSKLKEIDEARLELKSFNSFNFPVAFPEVFLRKNSGFDVIVGNPPWDKVRFEEDTFYCKHINGLMSLRDEDRAKAIEEFVISRPDIKNQALAQKDSAESQQKYFEKTSRKFKHQGSGHLELSKLFLERMLALKNKDGYLGIVLPRQSLVLGGWSDLREVLINGAELCVIQLQNKLGWVFPNVHQQYFTVLLAQHVYDGLGKVIIYPGARSHSEFQASIQSTPLSWDKEIIRDEISETLQIPLLLGELEHLVLQKISQNKKIKGLIDNNLYGIPYSILDVGKDLKYLDYGKVSDLAILRTRDICQFGYIPDEIGKKISKDKFQEFCSLKLKNSRDLNLKKLADLPFSDVLEIIYRYPTMSNNSRTLIATLLPPNTVPAVGYVHSLICPFATKDEKLFLLAILNSLIADWYVRKFVDRHITAGIVSNIPLPSKYKDSDVIELSLVVNKLIALNGFQNYAPDNNEKKNLYVNLNKKVFALYGLSKQEIQIVLDDFSEKALPTIIRKEILS